MKINHIVICVEPYSYFYNKIGVVTQVSDFPSMNVNVKFPNLNPFNIFDSNITYSFSCEELEVIDDSATHSAETL